jgi:DNA-binding beta-propeller fold protein YncE
MVAVAGPAGAAAAPVAYVANSDSNSITPIDLASNTPGPAIKVGGARLQIAITPNSQTAYVTDTSGAVTPVNTANNTPGTAQVAGTRALRQGKSQQDHKRSCLVESGPLWPLPVVAVSASIVPLTD